MCIAEEVVRTAPKGSSPFFPRALLELQLGVMEIATATPMFQQATIQREGYMSAETRRRAAENAFQRAHEAGHAVEQDDRFHAWIEEWIAGHIEMPEVARRYRSLLSERSAKRQVRAAAPVVENIQDPSGPETEQPFDLETEINQLMIEDQHTPKE
ncbi:hypothetical protein [Pararhizobium sp. LjRoot235]|uniref:hypothetical protein n=1 Tax=Pararhizobium sp. LjRoot235 TaxID=3342291 RepID=UPI003F4FB5C3